MSPNATKTTMHERKVRFGSREVREFEVTGGSARHWRPVLRHRRTEWPHRGPRQTKPVYLEAFGQARPGHEEEEPKHNRGPQHTAAGSSDAAAPLLQSTYAQQPRREEEQGDEVEEEDALLDEVEASWFRGAAARANYLAMDRVDLAYAAKELCRRMSVPRRRDLAGLRRLAQYVLGAPRLVQRFRWQRPSDHEVYVDTDFAGCPRTRRSTSGGMGMRGDHMIKHWSKTQKVVTLSSAEAELHGVVLGACEGLGIQAVAEDLGIHGGLRLRADSAAAIGICNRSGIGRVRHLAVGQLWIQESIRNGTLLLTKVKGEDNPADLCTKHLGSKPLLKCVAAVGCVFADGRSDAAPALAAQVEPFLEHAAPGPKRGRGKRG